MSNEIIREVNDHERRLALLESLDAAAKRYGSAFPIDGLFTGRQFFNIATGVNIEFYYSGAGGSEWRSTVLYAATLDQSSFTNPAAMPGAGNSLYSGMDIKAEYDYWIEQVIYWIKLTVAHTGVNYFTINYPGTTTTANTQNAAIGESRYQSAFTAYLISGVKPVGALAYRPYLTQVAAPTGTMEVLAQCLYRLVRPIPRDITGLILWLRPEELANLADSAAVATWPDASGNGNDATQATGASQPLLRTAIQNGRSIVRFDGSNDYMQIANPASFDLANYTIFVVGKASSGSGGSFVGKNDAAFADGRRRHLQIQHDYTANNVTHASGADSQAIIKSSVTGGSFYVIGIVARTTTDQSIIINGTETTYSTPTLNFTSYNGKNVTIGRPFLSTAAEHLTGDIAEILIYNSALSASDWGKVSTYLKSKWGIA